MGRARSAILLGARQALSEAGPRGLTMSGVAARGGVAKATVYNHFRDRGELVDGLALDLVEEILAVGDDAADLSEALAAMATAAAALPEVRGAVAHDPAVAARLLVPADGPAWRTAHDGITGLLARHAVPEPPVAADWVLRWLAAAAVAAPDPATLAAEARLTAAGAAGRALGAGG
jgi:AcrR family transcriptional regulator